MTSHSQKWRLAAIYLSAVVVFSYDVTHTEALAIGLLYLPMIWTSSVIGDPRAVWRLAAVAVTLVVVGALLPTVSPNVTVDLVNRVLSIGAIVATAGFVRYERGVRDRLADQSRAIERSDRARSQMFANLSHELRTPLNAVLGFSRLMRADARPDQIMPLSHIERAGERLLGTFENLIDLTQPGPRQMTPEAIDLGAVTADLASQLREAAAGRRVRITLLRTLGPTRVTADPWSVRRVLGNVLDNAVKFSLAGGEVRIGTERRGSDFAVTIADDGPGMTAEVAARLGELFFQADAGETRPFEGLGAGLALATRLTRELGGRLAFDTAPNAGTRVTLLLPPEPP